MRYTLLVALLAVTLGCSKEETQPLTSVAATEPQVVAQLPSVSDGDPSDILVEVDGKTLNRAQADEELGYRMTAIQSRIPPEKIPEFRARLFNNIIDQFIMRTVLLTEADRLEIAVTDEDQKNALAEIQKTLPPGLTPEEVMKNSPMGEERMREEMLIGIKVNKLLDTHLDISATVSGKEVDTFVAENKDRLAMPETIRARHILIKVEPTDDDTAKAEKKARIDAIHQELLDGADFAELAKAKSEGPSAPRGGDLGSFPRGKMVPEFEEAAFSQDLNAIGDVIQTKFGYHVLQVTERVESGQIPREKIIKMLANRKRQEQMTAYIEQLKTRAEIKDSRIPAQP